MVLHRTLLIYAGAFAIAFVTPDHTEAQRVSKCRPADYKTEGIVYELKRWLKTKDPEEIKDREEVFHVPVVPLDQIKVVKDERICAKVIKAYAEMPRHDHITQIYVIRMGRKHYVAHDPDHKAGEFSIVHIFNSKFESVGGWTGG